MSLLNLNNLESVVRNLDETRREIREMQGGQWPNLGAHNDLEGRRNRYLECMLAQEAYLSERAAKLRAREVRNENS